MSVKLNKLRAEITKVQAQIRETQRAALTDAQIEQRIDHWLDTQDAFMYEHFTSLADHFAFINGAPDDWGLLGDRLKHRGVELNLAMSVSLNRAEVKNRLLQSALKQVLDLPRVDDQAVILSSFRDSLLDLERAEEQEIERLEAAGEDVYRRADADPRAILGLEAE
ncbi:MAG: hypothetical protein ACTJG9_08750 [Alcaligenes aquatilis]